MRIDYSDCENIQKRIMYFHQAIREFQRKAHAPPLWESREVVIVAGGQDGLSKALEAIIGPGDPILVQNPFYPGVSVVVSFI